MNNDRTQLTLREWREHLLNPLTLTALAGVVAVLALVGPFSTSALLSLPERAAYWGALVIAGYVAGYLFSYVLIRPAKPSPWRILRVGLAGVLTGLTMALAVVLINVVVFDFVTPRAELPAFVGTVLGISVIVMAVLDVFTRRLAVPEVQPVAAKRSPLLLDRMALEKRGALVALSVEDHYVRVQTNAGEDMLLMRLADAMREVGDTRGDQVHRSHWAAFDQVVRVTKHGDRATLHMTTGADIPVSRSNMPKLKEAGLLP